MTDLLTTHQAILGLLQPALQAQGAVLYDGRVPDGADIPVLADGTVAPHAVLWMGDTELDPMSLSIDSGALVNALELLDFSVLCVAGTNLARTRVRDIVRAALVGQQLSGGSQIRPLGRTIGDQPVPTLLTPQRFALVISFAVTVGA